MDLFKFPRTKHLFNAGGSGVSRDDLLMDKGEETAFYTARGSRKKQPSSSRGEAGVVAIEEKVDGANIGISVDSETLEYKVQNRSHYVNSKTHRQFSTLDSWLSEHSEGLYKVLGTEPGRYVLFGEWLYAKHSILYTHLPDYFLAFDLYDLKEARFFSWKERNKRLEGTGIHTVKLVVEEPLIGREDVRAPFTTLAIYYYEGPPRRGQPLQALKWLNTDSSFYNGPCEGIYLRIDEDMCSVSSPVPSYSISRGKLVRPDFLQGIEEQWTRQKFTKNIVQHF